MSAGVAGPDVTLSLTGVVLSFGALRVVDNLSMEVRDGEAVALVGPNGAGKTSALNCINRVYSYSSGEIRLSDVSLRRKRPDEVARLGVARTFQTATTFSDMPVRDVVMLGRHHHLRHRTAAYASGFAALRRVEKPHRLACDDLLELLSISHIKDENVSNLPYGMTKRVDLARALAQEPKVLLLDEPASGLSQPERRTMSEIIRTVRQRLDFSMIMVEHDMAFVRRACERIVAMDAGRKIADGTCDEVLSDPIVIKSLLGTDEDRKERSGDAV